LIFLAGVVLALGSCTPRPGGRVVVTFWDKWGNEEAAAMNEIVADFNKSQDRIEVRTLHVAQIDVKLLLAVSGGNPPDVANLWTISVPDFSEKGALLPLDRLLREAGYDEETLIPKMREMCRHRGFTWAVPLSPTSMGMLYNRAMFREAGLDPNKPPQTLEELDAMSDRLTEVEIFREGKPVRVRYADLRPEERDPKLFKVIRAGHLPQEPGWWVASWMQWFGGRAVSDEGKLQLTSPESVAAFAWMARTSKKYGVDNLRAFGASFTNGGMAQNPFLSGKVAIVLHGSWMADLIARYAPGLDWAAGAFPATAEQVAKGLTGVVIIESDVLAIPMGAKHPREAAEFLAYCMRQEVAEKLALRMKRMTALKKVSPDFYARNENPEIASWVRLAQGPGAFYMPRVPLWREISGEMGVAGDRVRSLTMPPREALEEAEKRAQWRMDRVDRRWKLMGEQRMKEWNAYDGR